MAVEYHPSQKAICQLIHDVGEQWTFVHTITDNSVSRGVLNAQIKFLATLFEVKVLAITHIVDQMVEMYHIKRWPEVFIDLIEEVKGQSNGTE